MARPARLHSCACDCKLMQTCVSLAGEHTVVMLHPLQSALVEGTAWLDPFVQDFKARFMSLLAGAFKPFTPALALSLIHPQLTFSEAETQKSLAQPTSIRKADGSPLTAYDLKRLQVRILHTAAAFCEAVF